MLVSYIIIGFNSRKFLPACLGSIIADAPGDSEIILIDNASSDGTCEFVGREYPDIRLISNSTNIGHCKAVNQGFAEARGRYIILLDADTELQAGATPTMLKFLQDQPDIQLAAPRMLNPDGSVQETARRLPSIINAFFGRQTLLTRIFPNNRFTRDYLARNNLTLSEPFETGWVSSACMVFSRDTLERVGKWDEGYLGYWVDCDWCKRIQDAGGSIYCVPEAKVWHYEQNKPGRKKSLHRIRLFAQGARRYYIKHHTCRWWDPRAVLAVVFFWARILLESPVITNNINCNDSIILPI